jgi:hypothetical protein
VSADDDEVVTLARNLARNCGYAVFPCRDDKAPACPTGFKAASTDPAVIADLWRRWPGPLIGIATGEVSNIDVLDIDAKHPSAMAWWAVAAKRMPDTRTYRTRSGGLHVYLQHAEGVANTASKLARGVDTRGDGGYAISWFAAGLECLDQSPPAPWPAWLLECVLWKPPPAVRQSLQVQASVRADHAIEGIVRTIGAAGEGERNRVLFWGAARLAERMQAGQIGRGDAEALLITAARAAGLMEIEARRTIASAWKRAA